MICNFSRKLIACSKLNLPPPPPFVLSFNPMQYSTIGTSNLKEASYSSAELGRGSYLSSILDTLTGADIRVLVKFLEEASQATENQPSSSLLIDFQVHLALATITRGLKVLIFRCDSISTVEHVGRSVRPWHIANLLSKHSSCQSIQAVKAFKLSKHSSCQSIQAVKAF